MSSDTAKVGNIIGNLKQLRDYWPHRTNMHAKFSQNTVRIASAEVPELEEKARTSISWLKLKVITVYATLERTQGLSSQEQLEKHSYAKENNN